jgi:methylated-DNA-[protein]-cysteine S-methyltransferase
MPEVISQLDAYFAGERRAFELDLDLHGKPLQRKVWQQLLEIPYGKTTTYGEVAAEIDEALYDAELEPYKRPRVVGAAIGHNPVPVVVPCHRVIGADGSLTGFFGGLERKRLLLGSEGVRIAGDKVAGEAEPKQQLALL